jgi:septum formation protein
LSLQQPSPRLVLASESPSRRALLLACGLVFDTCPAYIDEAQIKVAARADGVAPMDCAVLLAELKAARVARSHLDAIVIGADQILVCNGEWFDKPANTDELRVQLVALRGQTHELVTAVVCFRDGQRVWHDISTAKLRVRRFSNAFTETYLKIHGEAAIGSVGGYCLEGFGMHLFDEISGEHSAILGLQMLPLLGFLRSTGILIG